MKIELSNAQILSILSALEGYSGCLRYNAKKEYAHNPQYKMRADTVIKELKELFDYLFDARIKGLKEDPERPATPVKTEVPDGAIKVILSDTQYDLILDGLSALSEGAENELRQTNDPDLTETDETVLGRIDELCNYLIAARHARSTGPQKGADGPDSSGREDILKAAKACVCGDRERDYGSPERNFETIAGLWNAYLGVHPGTPLDPKDVAAMLALLKIARIASGHAKADNWVDLAGYAACGGEIEAGHSA